MTSRSSSSNPTLQERLTRLEQDRSIWYAPGPIDIGDVFTARPDLANEMPDLWIRGAAIDPELLSIPPRNANRGVADNAMALERLQGGHTAIATFEEYHADDNEKGLVRRVARVGYAGETGSAVSSEGDNADLDSVLPGEAGPSAEDDIPSERVQRADVTQPLWTNASAFAMENSSEGESVEESSASFENMQIEPWRQRDRSGTIVPRPKSKTVARERSNTVTQTGISSGDVEMASPETLQEPVSPVRSKARRTRGRIEPAPNSVKKRPRALSSSAQIAKSVADISLGSDSEDSLSLVRMGVDKPDPPADVQTAQIKRRKTGHTSGSTSESASQESLLPDSQTEQEGQPAIPYSGKCTNWVIKVVNAAAVKRLPAMLRKTQRHSITAPENVRKTIDALKATNITISSKRKAALRNTGILSSSTWEEMFPGLERSHLINVRHILKSVLEL